MDLNSVPPLSPFNYVKWKLKMVSYLESHDLLDVSFGDGKESYENENDQLDDNEMEYPIMCMIMTPDMRYLIEYVECLFELWRNLNRAFDVHKEVDNTQRESNTSSSVLPSNVSASIISDEVVQNEETP